MKSSSACRTFPWATLRRINTAWLTLLVLNGRTSHKILCSNIYTLRRRNRKPTHLLHYFAPVLLFSSWHFAGWFYSDWTRSLSKSIPSQKSSSKRYDFDLLSIHKEREKIPLERRIHCVLNFRFRAWRRFTRFKCSALVSGSTKSTKFLLSSTFPTGFEIQPTKKFIYLISICHVFLIFLTKNSLNDNESLKALSKNHPRQNVHSCSENETDINCRLNFFKYGKKIWWNEIDVISSKSVWNRRQKKPIFG